MDHALTATGLLNVWERGRSQTPVERALALLAWADADTPPEAWARKNIGQRDAWLLRLREKLFGPRLTGQAQCPGCRRWVELDFPVAELRNAPAPEATANFTRQCGDFEVQFRLPNSEDLLTLSAGGELASQCRQLVTRCVTQVRRGETVLPADGLADEVIQELSAQMTELDPQGDVELVLTCPDCDQRWQAPLDIVAFLWSEIQAWAERLLREVHGLASAYGWREADILAMSASRRQAYLELIGQ